MAILGTKPAEMTEGSPASTGAKKEKKKALTVADRFQNFLNEVDTSFTNSYPASAEDCMALLRSISVSHAPKAKGAGGGQGAFYQIFGKNPVVGTTVSPADVLHLTDGKAALTEPTLKRWAEAGKGVPYGKGATAIVRFYRRTVSKDGTVNEAFYKLEAYEPAQEVEGVDALNV